MAVENKYVNSTNYNASGVLQHLAKGINCGGAQIGAIFETVEIAAADSDLSVYRFFKALDGNLIPLFVFLATDGITGGTAFEVGFYKTDLGVVIDENCLAATKDLSSASGFSLATVIDGMSAVAIEDRGKRIFEHCGHTIAAGTRLGAGYDLALTATTVGSGAGTVSVLMIYAQG